MDMSWKFPRNFREISRKFPRNFPEMSRKCSENVSEMFQKFPGNFLEFSWKFPGNFPNMSGTFSGNNFSNSLVVVLFVENTYLNTSCSRKQMFTVAFNLCSVFFSKQKTSMCFCCRNVLFDNIYSKKQREQAIGGGGKNMSGNFREIFREMFGKFPGCVSGNSWNFQNVSG